MTHKFEQVVEFRKAYDPSQVTFLTEIHLLQNHVGSD